MYFIFFPHRCTCSLHGTVTCSMWWSPVMAVRGWHRGTATDVCSVWTWTSARRASSVSSHPLLLGGWFNCFYRVFKPLDDPINHPSIQFNTHRSTSVCWSLSQLTYFLYVALGSQRLFAPKGLYILCCCNTTYSETRGWENFLTGGTGDSPHRSKKSWDLWNKCALSHLFVYLKMNKCVPTEWVLCLYWNYS